MITRDIAGLIAGLYNIQIDYYHRSIFQRAKCAIWAWNSSLIPCNNVNKY